MAAYDRPPHPHHAALRLSVLALRGAVQLGGEELQRARDQRQPPQRRPQLVQPLRRQQARVAAEGAEPEPAEEEVAVGAVDVGVPDLRRLADLVGEPEQQGQRRVVHRQQRSQRRVQALPLRLLTALRVRAQRRELLLDLAQPAEGRRGGGRAVRRRAEPGPQPRGPALALRLARLLLHSCLGLLDEGLGAEAGRDRAEGQRRRRPEPALEGDQQPRPLPRRQLCAEGIGVSDERV